MPTISTLLTFFHLHETDKRQHLWYSFSIFLILSVLPGWYFSITGTIIIGLLKELWDQYYGSGFCWYDMLANCLGLTLGIIMVLLLQVLYALLF